MCSFLFYEKMKIPEKIDFFGFESQSDLMPKNIQFDVIKLFGQYYVKLRI